MDSGSGSLQSSSGGDEEYDSHQPQFITPLPNFNIPPSHIISSGSIPQLPFHLPHNYQNLQPQPTFFDFSSHYNNLQPNLLNPDSSFINLDHMLRPTTTTTLRSDPTFKNLPLASSPPPQGSTQNQAPFRAGSSSVAAAAQPRPSVRDNDNENNNPRSSGLHPKNTKKRTRASRRAPTTVLTTDTSNFRAMVQEFTGIPAPPFSSSSSSYSRRFDLFGSASSAIRSTTTHLEPSGLGSGSASASALYPLRPKVQLFTSSTTPPLLNNNNNNVMLDSAASTSNQLLPSDNQQLAGLTKEPQTISNMQQQQQQQTQAGFLLSFQSLSEQGNNLEHHIHGGRSSHSQLVSASTTLQNDESWRGISAAGRLNNASNINCKLNFSGSSSKFHPDKEIMGNIRGENTVDSWICPSD